MTCSHPNCQPVSQRRTPLAATIMLLGLLTFIPEAARASSSCSFNGKLTVTISSTGLAFAAYDVLSAADTPGTGTIKISATCTHATLPFTVVYSIALSTGGGRSFTPRNMVLGTSKLQYNLYTDASLTGIWGDGTGGTHTVSDQIIGTCRTPNGNNCSGSQTDTVYGNIPAMQDVVAGNYSDMMNITVNF